MCEPTFFDVKYAINEHMLNEDGNLNNVDKSLANTQWVTLKKKFEELSIETLTITPAKDLPDMVFTANQTLPFKKGNKVSFILSNMHHDERKKEVSCFSNWLSQNNLETINLEANSSFEGMGDALWNYETNELFGGFGFRTNKEIYTEIEKITQVKVNMLSLINPKFYHLDTCLAIANKNTAFYVPSGFDNESQALLKSKFSNLIEIPEEEALSGFAANLCVVNGTDLIIQKGNPVTCEAAELNGLNVHTLDTSEFMKSGGSVFCMKQLFW